MEMNFLTKAIKALNKINRNKFYRNYAKVLNNTKLSDWGGIKPSVKDLEPYDIYMLGKIEEIEEKQVQPDWDQNDENAPDFIKNRICSEKVVTIASDQYNENAQLNKYTNDALAITPNTTYTITINGVSKTMNSQQEPSGTIVIYFPFDQLSGAFLYNPNGILGAPNNEKFQWNSGANPALYANAKIVISGPLITKTIDERFIPDTIVRTSQLGGAMFKVDSGVLKASVDGGSTWKTVTLS